MHTRALWAVALTLMLAAVALGQTQTVILGSDTTTLPDGGINRKVKVDSQGRLMTAGGTATDGGVTVSVPYCTVTQSRVTSVGTTISSVPASPLTSRWMVRVCNSARNSGTPVITCTSDGTAPDAGLLGQGEALEVGDCATYTTATEIRCISDTASTAVTSEECR